MVLFTVLVALANLVVGYTVAVVLGYGAPLEMLLRAGAVAALPAAAAQPAPGVAASSAETPAPPSAVLADALASDSLADLFLRLSLQAVELDGQLADIDASLRAQSTDSLDGMAGLIARLAECCGTYLSRQSETLGPLHEQTEGLGPLEAISQQVDMLAAEQAVQFEAAINSLKRSDAEMDAARAIEQGLATIQMLQNSLYCARDTDQQAAAAALRRQGTSAQLGKTAQRDPTTGLTSRVGMEGELDAWWHEGRPAAAPIVAAVFHIDNLGEINQSLGSRRGHAALAVAARSLADKISGDGIAARLGGARFAWIRSGEELTSCGQRMEAVRLALTAAPLETRGNKVSLACTAAAIQAGPQEPLDAFVVRLEAAINAAQTAGRGRSYTHDGQQVCAVEAAAPA